MPNEIASIEVKCGNPYFKGRIEGVQFRQATGGAVGMATHEQARAIVKDSAFSCDALKDDALHKGPPKEKRLSSIHGIGEASEQRLIEAGITSIKELAAASVDDLAGGTGVARPTATKWIEAAKAMLDE